VAVAACYGVRNRSDAGGFQAQSRLDRGQIQGFILLVIATKPRRVGAKPKERRWTFEELAAELPESNVPTELWDGELVMSPAPSFLHQEIVDRFHDLLKARVRPERLGKTAAAPIDMVLAPHRAMQPDVVFISNERLGIIKEQIMGAADLVAEVISPGSRRRDRIDKRDLYEQHGVREYWIIDPEAKTVEVLHLEMGTYQLVGRWHPGERAVSRLLRGFEVPVSPLLGEP
jgi:Uma2 family endonuclease